MTNAEILLLDYDSEISNTRRTLERVPDLPDFVPHEKSMKLGKLAMHCATMPLFGLYIMEDEGMDMAASKHPQADLTFTTRDACLQRLDETAPKCRVAIAAASDEHLAAIRANWQPKSDNLASIAEELGLGLDSLVFVDDNPAEIDIVRRYAPAEVPITEAHPSLTSRPQVSSP